MGIVRKDNSEKNELMVFFPQSDTGYESLSPAQILACDSAYAMTIHKSQGSEFDSVLIVLPEQTDHQLLTRELLYTAITRARKRVIIVGDIDIVLAASAHTVRRISGIQQQFAAV
ncbi:RecBCD enzyme subunit RecD [compost metagenome]